MWINGPVAPHSQPILYIKKCQNIYCVAPECSSVHEESMKHFTPLAFKNKKKEKNKT